MRQTQNWYLHTSLVKHPVVGGAPSACVVRMVTSVLLLETWRVVLLRTRSSAIYLRMLNAFKDLKSTTTVPLEELLSHLNLLRGLILRLRGGG